MEEEERHENATNSLLKEKEAGEGDFRGEKETELSHTVKLVYTSLVYATFIAFSLCRSMYGPSLPELQIVTSSTLDEISMVFTWLGGGGIMGSLCFGYLFDRFPPLRLFVMALMIMAPITVAIPWCTNFTLMMAVCAIQSFVFSGISTGCNVTIFRLWRQRASPVLLGMHLLYTVGGSVSPLICEPFLTTPATHVNHAGVQSNLSAALLRNISRTFSHDIGPTDQLGGSVLVGESIEGNPLSNTSSYSLPKHLSENRTNLFSRLLEEFHPKSMIYYTYAIIGIYIVIVAICNLILLLFIKYKGWIVAQPKYDQFALQPCHLRSIAPWIMFILFNSCLGGIETLFSGLLLTFTVNHADFTLKASSLLVALFFAAYGIGRFAAIFSVHCVPPQFIVLLHTTCALISTGMLSYFVVGNVTAIWGCTILMGFATSVLFATNLLWAKYFLPITGRFTSTYVVAYTIGMMTWPALTGHLLQNEGPQWFPYIGLGLSGGCILCLTILLLIQFCCRYPMDDTEMKDLRRNVNATMIASVHSLV